MKRQHFILVALVLAVFSCDAPSEKIYSPEEIEAETQKVNDFFQKTFDEAVDRYPIFQTQLGIKKDQDKWNDISEEFTERELEISKESLQ